MEMGGWLASAMQKAMFVFDATVWDTTAQIPRGSSTAMDTRCAWRLVGGKISAAQGPSDPEDL